MSVIQLAVVTKLQTADDVGCLGVIVVEQKIVSNCYWRHTCSETTVLCGIF